MFANEINDFYFYFKLIDDLNKRPGIPDLQRKI